MTSRERRMCVFRREKPDRAPVKVWGVEPGVQVVHASYQPLVDYALEKTDLVGSWSLPGGLFLSASQNVALRTQERPSVHANYRERVTIVETPQGPLSRIDAYSTAGLPGRCLEYLIETPEDARRFLSMPFVPVRGNCSSFFERDQQMGERGIVIVGFQHAMYSINAQMGSTTFALWSVERRALLVELIEMMQERCVDYVRYLLDQGVGPVFGYVGPELCIPPLQSVKDFRELSLKYDRQIVNLIHSRGGFVWCHCHGKMGPVLEDFADLGVDVLNPIEPPPMGDITIAEAKRWVGRRMALEGNIEKGEFYTATAERMRALVRQAVEEGAPGGGFILCPTSSFQEWPVCSETVFRNFRVFIDAGLEFAAGIR